MNSLEAKHLTKTYSIDSRSVTVLDDISLTVQSGEFVVVEGKSGSGKSTLLSILSGLDQPDSGKIMLSGTDITDLSEDELAPFRNRTIGFVFQSFHLVPSLTALENIMFPAELDKNKKAAEKARELIILGLYQENRISGGKAAELLGVSFRSLRYRLDKLGIERYCCISN